jgi:hypothetical protein
MDEQALIDRSGLREALKRVASALKAGGVPFALTGGYGLWARGAPEPEHDVDLVVALSDVEEAVRVLAGSGLDVVRPPEDWLFKVSTDGVIVDVLHRHARQPATTELLQRADEIEVLSMVMPVLPATDLLAAKLIALAEHFCDFTKLLPAARAVREQVDWARLRDEVAENDYALAFLFLADRLEISQPPG